jgi:deoxyadenosine/deoxycytidine kinase
MKRFLRYPDILVYLRTDPAVCHERMRRRARSQEAGVPLDYLARIHQKHEELIEEMSNYTRVLSIDWNFFGGDVGDINEKINETATEERKFLRDYRRL